MPFGFFGFFHMAAAVSYGRAWDCLQCLSASSGFSTELMKSLLVFLFGSLQCLSASSGFSTEIKRSLVLYEADGLQCLSASSGFSTSGNLAISQIEGVSLQCLSASSGFSTSSMTPTSITMAEVSNAFRLLRVFPRLDNIQCPDCRRRVSNAFRLLRVFPLG